VIFNWTLGRCVRKRVLKVKLKKEHLKWGARSGLAMGSFEEGPDLIGPVPGGNKADLGEF
jgi:hypothetical protein